MAKICEQTKNKTVWCGGPRRVYTQLGEKCSFGYNDWDIYHG